MSNFTNQNYLKNNQYRDSTNLDARIYLHRHFSTNPQGWYPWLFDTLETLPSKARVLELGCGSGLLWSTCPDRIPADWNITLSDISGGMLLAAWRNLVITGKAFKYEQFDAQSSPSPDKSFDFVIANHMLYHVPDRQKALQEIRRVLKPDGLLLASTVGEQHMQEIEGWLKQVSLNNQYAPFRSAFTLESGQMELASAFTNISRLRYPDKLHITETPALIAYIRSVLTANELSETALKTLQAQLEDKLHTDKYISVKKDTGLFLAHR